MSCAVCGGTTGAMAPRIQVPERLFGREACDRCGPSLQLLAEGRLSKDGLDAFIRYVEVNGSQTLIPELRRAWENPGVAQAAVSAHALPPELAAIAATSGFNFEGYRIIGYLGFVSAEVVLGMGLFRGISADFANFFGAESEALGAKLTEAKGAAFLRLRRQVNDLGGNGIIGTDLDYTMFGASLVGVIASGTAVFTEPVD